ncbi:MAG: vWA domain-containing protein, partial [Fusobacteriaceae bacterium]
KLVFFLLGAIFIFIALLGPQKLDKERDAEIRGLDIYVIIDISNSMMAEDVYPNRLARGKATIEKVLNNLGGDRIGFIPFSDSAYVQLPLTQDYSIARSYLNSIDATLISGGGTNLLSAIQLAEQSFDETESKNKVVLIISDGGEENNEIKKYLSTRDLKVFAVGIGTEQGSVVPLYNDGRKVGFIKDRQNKTVISQLNSKILESIADSGYYEVNNLSDTSGNFVRAIMKFEKDITRLEKIRTYKKYFQYPLFLGLIFILLAIFLRGGKNEQKN